MPLRTERMENCLIERRRSTRSHLSIGFLLNGRILLLAPHVGSTIAVSVEGPSF